MVLSDGKEDKAMGKTLVTYFSASGVTKKLAETIAETQKWDIKEIEPAVPYSDADLNWTDSHSRSTVEMWIRTAVLR